MVFIYILQLENNKYYIGKTNNPEFRIEQHFNSSGSEWTKKYKPIELIELLPNCDNFDEDKYTLKYMEKYGINNVRGGSFCEIKLSDSNLITLKQIINSVTDKCYICGSNEHFAKECNQKYNKKLDPNEKCDKCLIDDANKAITNMFKNIEINKYKFITEKVSIFHLMFPATTKMIACEINETDISICCNIIVDCENNFTSDEKNVINNFNINNINDLIRNNNISKNDKQQCLHFCTFKTPTF
jgi:hypothetical protein